MKTQLINLTPHTINLVGWGDIEPTLPAVRVDKMTNQVCHFDGLPLVQSSFGTTYNLPAPKHGTWLVVSNIVKQANPNRADLMIPIRPLRDAQGKVTGCQALEIMTITPATLTGWHLTVLEKMLGIGDTPLQKRLIEDALSDITPGGEGELLEGPSITLSDNENDEEEAIACAKVLKAIFDRKAEKVGKRVNSIVVFPQSGRKYTTFAKLT